ncbi:hypothetical protein A8W25_20800 [Streptomyces sp. ERV7]|uniref:RNA polymerase sigma factor n=1 Tax=Streptomyces sp. ERV7 TaxID=1322334 RepID=UPI0007F4B184|nr:sigma-70 family RNA polymerase sigma factor [Streptomyces sp. ERV7]OAR24788.1 hypothetical protein A8W25_20800 [Streptomyces sp. ERV7]
MRLRREAVTQDVSISVHYRSVASIIRTWESGDKTPNALYRRLLTAVYGESASVLGLPEPTEPQALNAERLGRIYARYQPWLLARIHRIVGDYHLAEDLTHDTFINAGLALDKVEEWKDAEELHPWLAMHARWVIGTYRRHHDPQRHERLASPIDDDDRPFDFPAADELSRPEETVSASLDLHRMLAILPAVQRQLITLVIQDGLSVRKAAARLDLTYDRARGLHTQAVNALLQYVSGPTVQESAA